MSHLSTGDVVLFSGTTLAARSVRYFTGSRWSHVGVIVRHPDWGDRPLLWEATRASPLKDIPTGSVGDGVQLVCLQEKVAAYPGQVAVRCWEGVGRRPGSASVERVFERLHARPYRDYVRRNLHCWLGRERHEHAKGTFCSEFVAEVLSDWGLLQPDRPLRHYLPSHFAGERGVLTACHGQLGAIRRLMPETCRLVQADYAW